MGESKKSENVKSKSVPEIKTREERDENEMMEQLKLWREADKKKQWHDPAPKMKVRPVKEGRCFMDMEFTLGLPPQAAYDVLTNPDNQSFSRMIDDRELMHNVSRRVVSTEGSRQYVEVEKEVAWKFLWLSGVFPMTLVFGETPKKLMAVYMKKKMRFMKHFEGSWKLEPLYVDSKHFCNNIQPKSREEYIKCSGGKGRIATKVTMDQYFQPSPPFNLPPFSWFIRRFIVKTTKTLLEDLQDRGAIIRGV